MQKHVIIKSKVQLKMKIEKGLVNFLAIWIILVNAESCNAEIGDLSGGLIERTDSKKQSVIKEKTVRSTDEKTVKTSAHSSRHEKRLKGHSETNYEKNYERDTHERHHTIAKENENRTSTETKGFKVAGLAFGVESSETETDRKTEETTRIRDTSEKQSESIHASSDREHTKEANGKVTDKSKSSYKRTCKHEKHEKQKTEKKSKEIRTKSNTKSIVVAGVKLGVTTSEDQSERDRRRKGMGDVLRPPTFSLE